MRANATVREPEIQAYWADRRVYESLAESNPGEPYTLHDGPPYANGDLHIGHAMNKVRARALCVFLLLFCFGLAPSLHHNQTLITLKQKTKNNAALI
jgi:hypothetical protein